MPSCAFIQCTNHSRRKNKTHGITFHAFPQDELWKHKWLVVVRNQRREYDWLPTKHSRICSIHFRPGDLYKTNEGLTRITKGAVPYFQLKQDMDNFMEYKIMGSVKRIKMKVNAAPSRNFKSPSTSQNTLTNTKRLNLVQGTENCKPSEDYIEPTVKSSKTEMGAKTSVKLRARGAAFKCNMCGRKLMSMEALVSHERTAHNIITRRNKPKQATKPMNATKKEAKKEVKPVKKEVSPPKMTQKVPEPISNPVESKDNTLPRKETVEFKCPKCVMVFATYFPAHKHIQKFHCVNKEGVKVPPNSPNLIQPIRIELCILCNKKVSSMITHECNQVLICTACDAWMPNLKAFDLHVRNHVESLESLFFPNITEFTNWKSEMEAQTSVNYIILEKYNTKKYYHCSFIKENNAKADTTYICPSSIVVQEFSKGIQVHFYKEHHKHHFTEYALTEKYKKFSITTFLKRSEEYNNLPPIPSDDSDLYLQFKSLMEGIIVDAAKLNITTLKVLLGKALDMTSLLTNYDEEVEENDVTVNVNHMTDAQITTALELHLPRSKRRNSENPDNLAKIKRVKDEPDEPENNMSPKIVNSFSLADNTKPQLENDKSDTESTKSDEDVDKKSNERDPYSSAFNDSYKDFVVKNFPVAEADVKKKRNRRPAFQTKIGQFKPNILPKLLPKPPTTPEVTKVKEETETPVSTSFEKPNIDIKYEVKEQEEGCNILILKL